MDLQFQRIAVAVPPSWGQEKKWPSGSGDGGRRCVKDSNRGDLSMELSRDPRGHASAIKNAF